MIIFAISFQTNTTLSEVTIVKTFLSFLLFNIIITMPLVAQNSIKGIVFDAKTEVELPQVNIYLTDYPYGTTSDSEGYFNLIFPDTISEESTIEFKYVGYNTFKITIAQARGKKSFSLKPETLEGSKIVVQDKKESQVARELPVSITIIDAKRIESKGLVDAGDLLRVSQNVQIDEQINGKKLISIRAGNPENVLVLYNGVRMNNHFDNIFDLSLINVEDIKQVEILTGSNTSLYGSEALSGVVNIVPKMYQPHNIRFIQKFGSYNSGDWSLQLNKRIWLNMQNEKPGSNLGNRSGVWGDVYFSYSHRRSAQERLYSGGNEYLRNEDNNQRGSITYNFATEEGDTTNKNLTYMFIQTVKGYKNNRTLDTNRDINTIHTFTFNGDLGLVTDVEIIGSLHNLKTKQHIFLNNNLVSRRFDNNKMGATLRKSQQLGPIKLVGSYSFDNVDVHYYDNRLQVLDDVRSNIALKYNRKKQGIVGLISVDSERLKEVDKMQAEISYRHDIIEDDYGQAGNEDANNKWDEGLFKATFKFTKKIAHFNADFMFNIGKNVRYPTILNQLSTPATFSDNPIFENNLNPEKNRSTEASVRLHSDDIANKKFDYWNVNVIWFNNLFENKIRNFYNLESPLPFFDNIKTAELSGVEAKALVSLFKETFIAETGITSYNISDKAAFPLKAEYKTVANIMFSKYGFEAQANWFKEGEKVSWMRALDGTFTEFTVPDYSNINLHLSKMFKMWGSQIKFTFSAANLLTDKTKVNGLAIHDRRLYAGFEFKY